MPRESRYPWVKLGAALLLSAAFHAACVSDLSPAASPRPKPAGAGGGSVQAVLGVPLDGDPSDDTLVDEAAFLVSYNPRRRAANWVAWKLEASDLGHTPRRNRFHADPALPGGMYRVTPHDYSDSGYDRGHLCPFGDRTGSIDGAERTFVMTNMEPQTRELNAGPWERLEAYERVHASVPGRTLFIVAGGVFDEAPERIGNGISVPRAAFKIVVSLARGQGPGDVTESTPTLAVEMPNEHGVRHRDFRDFVTSIDRIEADTGYDFLSAVQPSVQAVIEARAPREL